MSIISTTEAKAALGVLWPGDWEDDWDTSDHEGVGDASKTDNMKNQKTAAGEVVGPGKTVSVSSRR